MSGDVFFEAGEMDGERAYAAGLDAGEFEFGDGMLGAERGEERKS